MKIQYDVMIVISAIAELIQIAFDQVIDIPLSLTISIKSLVLRAVENGVSCKKMNTILLNNKLVITKEFCMM